MPSGVYARKKRKAPKPAKAGKPSTQMEQLQAALAELQERIRLMKTHDSERRALLAYCKRHELTRADLKWVIEELPKERISRKDREKALHNGDDQ